jgi:radical SAM superfamily enzyme YgiQ (UPF0313 family)
MSKQKVLLVGPEQEENLSLRYLGAALVAAGHDVVIAPFNRAEDHASVIEAGRDATLVGLSLCFQVRAREFFALARALKAQAPHRRIVAGGHYASCAVEDLLAHHPEIDLVVIHEGEQTLVELANAQGRPTELEAIQGLAFRRGDRVHHTEPRPLRAGLDELPPPLRTGPARLLAGVPTAYLLGSRGCVGHCDYCCITTLHRMVPGKRFRQRDPRRIAEEMAQLYHDRGVRQFIFHDDNFLVPSAEKNHRRIDALQAALQQRGVEEIAFTLKCRPQDVQRPIFEQLRQMGLIRVFLGIESASEVGLACLGREHSRGDAAATLWLCQDLGISAQYTMMIFHPDATLDTCRADLDFMREHIDFPLNFCRTEVYPGTPLEQRMEAAGRLRGSYLGRSYTITDERVQWISDLSARLFFSRCWATGGLLERSIGLDHLAAVVRRFYGGRRATRLADQVLSWRRLVNQDTLALLERLFEVGAAHRAAEVAWLRSAVERLRGDEEAGRRALQQQGQDLFDQLNELTLARVGLAREARSVVVDRSRPLERLARHAAAALLAVSVASWSACDEGTGGVSEFAPPPVDSRADGPRGDGRVDGARTDAGADASPVDGSAGDGDGPSIDATTDARPADLVRIDLGHSEYAGPPVDAGPDLVRIEAGHSEYAGPPVDAGDDDS